VLAQGAPPGGVINLGGGNRVSLADATRILGEVMEIEPAVVRQAVEAGDVKDTLADVSRAFELIGYAPTTPLKAGLTEECGCLGVSSGNPGETR